MGVSESSILLIGESGVGKSHYGGQLLKRLMQEDGRIRMDGAPTNLQPFKAVMASLDAGLPAVHTATAVYDESLWPIIDDDGRKAHLVWPDYGGEQIKNIIDERRLPHVWLNRVAKSSGWLLLIRLTQTRADDDIFTRPMQSLKEGRRARSGTRVSDQARLIELLQLLAYAQTASGRRLGRLPFLLVLLTCWDELGSPGKPIDVLDERLPMLRDFVASNWEAFSVLGISALGRALDKSNPDEDYITQGSEQFGYVVLEDGTRSPDLTLPIRELLANST